MSNFSTGDPKQFFKALSTRLGRLETNLGQLSGKTTRAIQASKQVFVGPVSPVPGLQPGTEYVWYRTNGTGTLLETIVSVA